FFFFQAEDGIRDFHVTGVQTCALPILHQPAALDGIDLLAKVLPDVPAVACFDTTFHATLPPGAATYAVPEEWRSRYGVRRFGFRSEERRVGKEGRAGWAADDSER